MKIEFENWLLNNASGAKLRQQEQAFFTQSKKEVNGQVALQLGMSCINLLEGLSVSHCLQLQQRITSNTDIQCDYLHLPIPAQTVDAVFLAHVLEFSEHPQQILHELYRILRAEGKLIITGFNPIFAARFCRDWNGQCLPYRKNCIALSRLKDWLDLLGFDVVLGRFMVYTPLIDNINWLEKLAVLDKAGNRWYPHHSLAYGIVAVKRICGMHLRPEWANNDMKDSQTLLTPARVGFNHSMKL